MNQEDVSGTLLNLEGYNAVHLMLPMEYETKRKSKTIILPSTNGKAWEDPREKEGELLFPERMGPTEVKNLKSELKTSYRIAGQLQQRPAPEGGGLLKRSYFKLWRDKLPPPIEFRIQSWDTALEANETDAYSACTTWGIFREEKSKVNNIILLGMWRGRVQYPELRKMAVRLYNDYRDDGHVEIKPDGAHIPDVVLIEAKASGHSLVHDLSRAGIAVFGFDPTKYGDKLQRVQLASYLLEAGRVWVPAKPPDFIEPRIFANNFIELCTIFPAADARDVVDTMAQTILRLRDSGYLTHSTDDTGPIMVRNANRGFYSPEDI